MKRIIMLFLLSTRLLQADAQQKQYPQHYFRNPTNLPLLLAGNFGECRPNHFHSGLDIKTAGIENQPIYAAADGYISRIRLSPSGFGHALYIDHPNGYSTLYAHLNDFAPAIQKLARSKQYEQENWEIDMTLSPEQLPVKKGQLIAYSGNTGSSTAPHLHFEIRDSKTEAPLNPQLFGFRINDKKAPQLKQVAIYNLDKSIYKQNPQIFTLQLKNGIYAPAAAGISVPYSNIGIALFMDDYMEGSTNSLAQLQTEWYLNKQFQGRILLDDISYDQTRYLNAYADYKTKKLNGNWFQCLFKLPGNRLDPIYEGLNPFNGALQLDTGRKNNVEILVSDAENNRSKLLLSISVLADTARKSPVACTYAFAPNAGNKFATPNVQFQISETALYDSICFVFQQQKGSGFSDIFQLHNAQVPLHESFELFIKPNTAIPFNLCSKIYMQYSDGKSKSGIAASKDDKGFYKARVKAFGTYQLMLDTTAPGIVPVSKSNVYSTAKDMRFRVKEEATSVKSFRATLKGQWLLFEQSGDTYYYRFDDNKIPKGKHILDIEIIDQNGNVRNYQYAFVR